MRSAMYPAPIESKFPSQDLDEVGLQHDIAVTGNMHPCLLMTLEPRWPLQIPPPVATSNSPS
jgi:hypothetical protein